MFKKITTLAILACLTTSLCGCAVLLIGAGAAGTAYWMQGKLTQDLNTPFDRSVDAAKNGLRALRMTIDKETLTDRTAQFMSKYTDGRTVWVDIEKRTEAASRIEVRVGATGDKDAAQKVMNSIRRYL
ncbi:MAG: DUF3568 family protein [Candidatus Omnitrophica bacterium]|nr:DUF3568 family protein [Candidatus Omnitrophota bacterium]